MTNFLEKRKRKKKLKMLVRFAAGKGTAVVVDMGDDVTTVTPICDGFVLRKGTPSLFVCVCVFIPQEK